MSALLPLLAASTPARSLLSPAVTVEIAFNAGYSTAASARVWTDVTQYVQVVDGIDITHGRGDERGQADANSLHLVLKNSDGRFTPDLSTSPYYPNVKLGRPIRVSVMTAAGYTSVRFVGYIDEWPLEWPAVVDTYAVSAITATSRIARLGASAPLGNHIYEEIKRDSPVAHYMLDNLADSVSGGVALVQAGTGTAVAFEGTGPTDGISAAQFAGGKYLTATRANFFTAGVGFTLEAFVAASAPGTNAVIVGAHDGASLNGVVNLRFSSTGAVIAGLYSGGDHIDAVTSGASISDGNVHHVAGLWAGDGLSVSLYVDGVLQGSGTTAVNSPVTTLYIGGGPSAGFGPSPNMVTLTGTVAHAAAFSTLPAAARIADHSTAGRTGFAGETAEDRLKRYAAWAGIPTAEQSISTAADTPMAYIDTTGQTALALMQKVAETDGGVLYDARDGTLTYAARTARYNAATAVTLDASAGQVAASYAPKLDRSSLINEVVATIADGSDPQETVTAKNTTSYTDYGPHHEDIELATTDEDEAHAAAWWRVNTYGEPRARAPQLGVEIAHLPAVAGSTQRFYFSHTVASPITPAYQGTWDATGNALRRKLLTAAAGSDAGTVNNSETSTSPQDLLCYQHNSDALAAGTLTGSIRIVMQGKEAQFGADATARARVSLIAADGTTLLADLGTTTNATELDLTEESRTLTLTLASPVTVPAGAYLSVEQGTHHANTTATSTNSTIRVQASSAFTDHTFTDGEGFTSKRGWIEVTWGGTTQESILALNVGSKVTVSNLPSQSDATSKSFFVEGYAERIGPETHEFEFNISPTTGFDVWTVEDATYGQYDAYPIAY